MRIIFMGTPDFSVETMEALLAAGHEIVLAVTQPDRPKGRHGKVTFSPVKEAALRHGIPVYQPVRIKKPECLEELKKYQPDICVVIAFGQILPESVLDLPKYGCVNVHASLLPKYRGAAPIQWAVANGDPVSGVTTMQMDTGMDTGDILLKEEVKLAEKETGGSLFERLSGIGAQLCVRTLQGLEEGNLKPVPQDSDQATYSHMIKKKDGLLDFSESAKRLECLIRAMNPWPSAFTHLGKKTLKIWGADIVPEDSGHAPGEISQIGKDFFCVQTGEGQLQIRELQLEGKKRMDSASFMRGYPLKEGTLLQ